MYTIISSANDLYTPSLRLIARPRSANQQWNFPGTFATASTTDSNGNSGRLSERTNPKSSFAHPEFVPPQPVASAD